MMDFHVLIVISCVFLASLCSLLFINKFFRRKTFEEIIAEKKAMTEKIYGQSKAGAKKPKKIQQLKKEQKREKKQRQKEQQHQREATTEQEDSDAQTDHFSVDDEPEGLSKIHVEFDPDPEIMTPENSSGHTSAAEKEIIGGIQKPKSKKDKKGGKMGILVNKNEPIAIKENLVAVAEPLNNFEARPPKDVVELKRQEKDKKDDKHHKKEKNVKKEKVAPLAEQPVTSTQIAAEVREPDEPKVRHNSPKNLQSQLSSGNTGGGSQGHNNNNTNSTNNNNNKTKQQIKKQIKETAATKELVMALDKLSETDTIGVSLLMNLFRRADLNRSEIQILIDYLLNKQQDMPSSHSEWSDDICQKLKRQLEEKERALVEEQEASIGIQAKLRELRTEINSERAQMNATTKDYINRIQIKDQEIFGLNQELQSINDKLTLERQHTKLLREKQVGSQDVLAQLKIMQIELVHKDKTIAELTCMGNVARQAAEEAQQDIERLNHSHAQQIQALEQQREELEQIANSRIFEIEKANSLQTENAEYKLEVRNLQNALESANADLAQACRDVDATKAEMAISLNVQLGEKQLEIQRHQLKNEDLLQQLEAITRCTTQQRAEMMQTLTGVEDNARQQHQLQQELQRQVEALQADIASKHKQLQEAEQQAEETSSKEKQLVEQLNDQREKNNDLRMKNWKLVEALKNAETTIQEKKTLPSANANLIKQEQQLFAATAKHLLAETNAASSVIEEQHVRDLFERFYPEAVRACASTALSLPFEQWAEQVLATHVQQGAANAAANITTNISSSNKATQSSNNHNSTSNSHMDNSNVSNIETTNNSNSRISSTNNPPNDVITSSSSDDSSQKLHAENANLRVKIDELTKLVKKTSNTLSELEGRAREQDENWRSIVRSKDEQIYSLQHSNGEQSDI